MYRPAVSEGLIIFTTCPRFNPKYRDTGSPAWILINMFSFSLYLANSSCFSSGVITTCSGTNLFWKNCYSTNILLYSLKPHTNTCTRFHRNNNYSCSVILINSSDSKNCSKIYLGAMSTKDCFADGVIPAWTTTIAR